MNVIMSDSDAVWLGDPARDLFGGTPSLLPGEGGDRGDRIHDSDVVASRGSYPRDIGKAWGSTICMGFILLRTKNTLAMKKFLDVMEDLVLKTKDDQVLKPIANLNVTLRVRLEGRQGQHLLL